MEKAAGKIDQDFFGNIFQNRFGKIRSDVSIRPGFGVDVAVINISDQWDLAMASDPATLIPQLGLEESAWLSVQLTANDIATTGFAPQFGQFVLNLPPTISPQELTVYWKYIHQFCTEIGIAITGGHTGFVEGQYSTISGSSTLMCKAGRNEFLTSTLAKPGDKLLITKSAALSASAILAMSFPERVRNKAGLENYHQACASFYDTSVLKDALTAVQNKNKQYISAMHDVTEGGLIGAIYELAFASGNGAYIFDEKLPVSPAQAAVCEVFSLNPKESIGAGALVIACKEEGKNKIISDLLKEGIPCVEIGELTKKSSGFKISKREILSDWQYQSRDPYWDAFASALKKGWK